MAGGNLAAGIALAMTALTVHFLVAFMVSEGANASVSGLAGCSNEDNLTECEDVSKTAFLSALLAVTISGFSDVPVVDGLYLITIGGAFVSGIVLIVMGLVGSIAGGG